MKENELVATFNNVLERCKVVYANEVRMGIGIPDIAFLDKKVNSPYINDYYTLKIYNAIVENRIENTYDLYSQSKLAKRKTDNIVKELISKNLLIVNNNSIFINYYIDFSKLPSLSSVEVKVKDWRGGFYQALRYSYFSDYSYLAIHSRYVKNVDLQILKNNGVGLISIEDVQLKILQKARKSKTCDSMSKYIAISNLTKKFKQYNKNNSEPTCFYNFNQIFNS